MAAMAATSPSKHFDATTVGIVSADNAGANGTEAALDAALDNAGIAHTTVKGGDNETDAGYQGLMREADGGRSRPAVLAVLRRRMHRHDARSGVARHRDPGDHHRHLLRRARCSTRSATTPSVGTSSGSRPSEDTPELAILQEIVAPALGVEPSDVDSTALGLGALGLQHDHVARRRIGNQMADDGTEVTGRRSTSFLGIDRPGSRCGPTTARSSAARSPTYPTICSFTFPIAEYVEGGEVITIEGLEAVSVTSTTCRERTDRAR